jgi:hypothetical protein
VAGEARRAHRISETDGMVVGGSALNAMKGTFIA